MKLVLVFIGLLFCGNCLADSEATAKEVIDKIAASEAEFEKIFWDNHKELGLDKAPSARELASDDEENKVSQ